MEKTLHFYPKTHLMIWVVEDKVAARIEAWGGAEPATRLHYDVMRPRPTTPGVFVIHSCEPYQTKTWPWSRIPWGTRLSLSATSDFGAMAVRYFKDRNNNRRLDHGEKLSGEMIHTTPDNEAQTAKGDPISMESSHGCIHVSPHDRDRLRNLGAFDRGSGLIIHTYTESVPARFQ